MKRFLTAAACLIALVACQPDPFLTIDQSSLTFPPEGGKLVVNVASNYEWHALPEITDVTVTPSSGAANAVVEISMGPNTFTDYVNTQVVFTCSSKDMSVTKVLKVTQQCVKGTVSIDYNSVKIEGETSDKHIGPEGGIIYFDVTANAPWEIKVEPKDVICSTTGGINAGTMEVKLFVPECPDFEGRNITAEVSCNTAAGASSDNIAFIQDGGLVKHGDDFYHAAKMKDGKYWMTENLRYIPAGMTPTDDLTAVDNGIWYPLVIDVLTADAATVKFSKDEKDIKANGYLYNTETALGVTKGTVTKENAASFEGVQGICPSGWHIPTKADIIALVGKTADKNETNEAAPYYDVAISSGSVAKLNEDGFNASAWGAVSIANMSTAKATTMGAIKTYLDGMNTGYIAGSTYYKATEKDGVVTNHQFVGLMPNMKSGTYAGAYNNYRNGVSVRCVKNN